MAEIVPLAGMMRQRTKSFSESRPTIRPLGASKAPRSHFPIRLHDPPPVSLEFKTQRCGFHCRLKVLTNGQLKDDRIGSQTDTEVRMAATAAAGNGQQREIDRLERR